MSIIRHRRREAERPGEGEGQGPGPSPADEIGLPSDDRPGGDTFEGVPDAGTGSPSGSVSVWGALPDDDRTEGEARVRGPLVDGPLVGTADLGDAQRGHTGVTVVEERVRRSPGQPASARTNPRQFVREVNVELHKVVWPSRRETANYSSVVLLTLVVLMALIFGLDYGFNRLALFLFK